MSLRTRPLRLARERQAAGREPQLLLQRGEARPQMRLVLSPAAVACRLRRAGAVGQERAAVVHQVVVLRDERGDGCRGLQLVQRLDAAQHGRQRTVCRGPQLLHVERAGRHARLELRVEELVEHRVVHLQPVHVQVGVDLRHVLCHVVRAQVGHEVADEPRLLVVVRCRDVGIGLHHAVHGLGGGQHGRVRAVQVQGHGEPQGLVRPVAPLVGLAHLLRVGLRAGLVQGLVLLGHGSLERPEHGGELLGLRLLAEREHAVGKLVVLHVVEAIFSDGFEFHDFYF